MRITTRPSTSAVVALLDDLCSLNGTTTLDKKTLEALVTIPLQRPPTAVEMDQFQAALGATDSTITLAMSTATVASLGWSTAASFEAQMCQSAVQAVCAVMGHQETMMTTLQRVATMFHDCVSSIDALVAETLRNGNDLETSQCGDLAEKQQRYEADVARDWRFEKKIVLLEVLQNVWATLESQCMGDTKVTGRLKELNEQDREVELAMCRARMTEIATEQSRRQAQATLSFCRKWELEAMQSTVLKRMQPGDTKSDSVSSSDTTQPCLTDNVGTAETKAIPATRKQNSGAAVTSPNQKVEKEVELTKQTATDEDAAATKKAEEDAAATATAAKKSEEDAAAAKKAEEDAAAAKKAEEAAATAKEAEEDAMATKKAEDAAAAAAAAKKAEEDAAAKRAEEDAAAAKKAEEEAAAAAAAAAAAKKAEEDAAAAKKAEEDAAAAKQKADEEAALSSPIVEENLDIDLESASPLMSSDELSFDDEF